MEPLDIAARDGLQDIRTQLDRLCALAQIGRARIEIPGRNRAHYSIATLICSPRVLRESA